MEPAVLRRYLLFGNLFSDTLSPTLAPFARECYSPGMERVQQVDLAVIGSGAGSKVALAGAKLGLSTVLFESGPMGGTCLNRGCIPSKMLIYPALLAERIRESAHLGIQHADHVSTSLPALADRLISETESISNELLATYQSTPGLTIVRARARFTGPREVEAAGVRYAAKRVLIATGADPAIPSIPGLANTPYLTSTELLRNRILPKRLAIIGAGYIAAELGHAYGAMGCQVIFIVRSHFLRHEDPDAAAAVVKAFRLRHQLFMGYQPVSVSHGAAGFSIQCEGPAGVKETIGADALLVATGIKPCTEGLGLDKAGVDLDLRGFIRTDARLRTTAENVWALGDVIGRHAFRHTANYEAEYLERTVLEGRGEGPLEYGPVPHAVFTRPEIGGVGLTEHEAREAGYNILVAKADFADSSNAGLARGLNEGFVKIVAECGTGRVLGAVVVGDEAATIVHLFIMLIKKRGTLQDLRSLIFIHPALPEVVRDAVRSLSLGSCA
jgi:mycothione reductase